MGVKFPYTALATPTFSVTCSGCQRKERFAAGQEPKKFGWQMPVDVPGLTAPRCPECLALQNLTPEPKC